MFARLTRVIVKDLRDGGEDAVFVLDDIEPAAERRIGERESEDLAELHIILRGALGDETDAEPLAHHLLDALGRADLDRRAQRGDVDAVLAQKLLARLIGAAALFAADERLLPNLPDGEGTARIGTCLLYTSPSPRDRG